MSDLANYLLLFIIVSLLVAISWQRENNLVIAEMCASEKQFYVSQHKDLFEKYRSQERTIEFLNEILTQAKNDLENCHSQGSK